MKFIKIYSALCWLILLLAGGVVVAHAQPLLATRQVSNLVVGMAAIRNDMTISLSFGFDTNIVLFDQFILTAADVGSTFTLHAGNDPDFAPSILNLQNGFEDPVFFGDGLGGSLITSEESFFSPLPAGNNGIDFQGFVIESIALTVDTLTFNSPGSNPNNNGIWTDIFFQGTITLYAVPEPTAISLAGVTGIALLARLRRDKPKNALG